MPCEIHPQKKQGKCRSCHIFKCCLPFDTCQMRNEHLQFKSSSAKNHKSSINNNSPFKRKSKRNIESLRKNYCEDIFDEISNEKLEYSGNSSSNRRLNEKPTVIMTDYE